MAGPVTCGRELPLLKSHSHPILLRAVVAAVPPKSLKSLVRWFLRRFAAAVAAGSS